MKRPLTPQEAEALRRVVDARGAMAVAVSVGCALPTLRAALRGATLAGVTRTAILSTTPEARAA